MSRTLIALLFLVAVCTAVPLEDSIIDWEQEWDDVEENPGPKPEVKYPVLLVPGLSASQIDARLNKTKVPHYYCAKKSDWFTLWLNPSELLPGVIDCWIDNFKLVFNNVTKKTENTPGVETRVPGFGDVRTIEYLSSVHLPASEYRCTDVKMYRVKTFSSFSTAGYFHNLITGLLKAGYKRNETIRGAPYDFRRAPSEYIFV